MFFVIQCNTEEGDIMSTISLRMNDEEEKLIKTYAKLNNLSVSELVRNSVLEKIEDDIDLEIYHQAMKEHILKPNDITFDEMMKELGLDT